MSDAEKTERVLKLFGGNLVKLREDRGWSAAELGERSRVDVVKVGQIERGEVSATLKDMRRFAGALGVQVSPLVGLHAPSNES